MQKQFKSAQELIQDQNEARRQLAGLTPVNVLVASPVTKELPKVSEVNGEDVLYISGDDKGEYCTRCMEDRELHVWTNQHGNKFAMCKPCIEVLDMEDIMDEDEEDFCGVCEKPVPTASLGTISIEGHIVFECRDCTDIRLKVKDPAPVTEKPKKVKKEKKERTIELTPMQKSVIAAIVKWFKKKGFGMYELAGYAGVGKSTVVDFLLEELGLQSHQVRMCAPTGKASLVLKEKTPEFAEFTSTLHKLFYRAKQLPSGAVRFVPTDENIKGAKLIIIDESSMVGEYTANQIIPMAKRAGVKVLIIGDPGQLPPVGQKEYFFKKPETFLTEVLRQAKDNPIINLSMMIRAANDKKQMFYFGSRPVKLKDNLFILNRADMKIAQLASVVKGGGAVICGRNATRAKYNREVREFLGFNVKDTLMEGEKIMVKKNMDEDVDGCEVTNGMVGTATNVKMRDNMYCDFTFVPDAFEGERKMTVRMDVLFEKKDDPKAPGTRMDELMEINRKLFEKKQPLIEVGAEMVLGYIITAHASQGSQWDKVVVINEADMCGKDRSFRYKPDAYKEQNRWLYTAVTRAAKVLVVFTDM